MMVQYLSLSDAVFSGYRNEVHVVPSGRHRAAGISRPVSVPGSQLTHRTTAFGVHLLTIPSTHTVSESPHTNNPFLASPADTVILPP